LINGKTVFRDFRTSEQVGLGDPLEEGFAQAISEEKEKLGEGKASLPLTTY